MRKPYSPEAVKVHVTCVVPLHQLTTQWPFLINGHPSPSFDLDRAHWSVLIIQHYVIFEP